MAVVWKRKTKELRETDGDKRDLNWSGGYLAA